MRERFGPTLEAAAQCELFAWRESPEGRAFAYMPYMHSESLPIHAQAVQRFS